MVTLIRQPASLPTPLLLSVRKRLVRQPLELLGQGEVWRPELAHEYADQLVLGIDPEKGAKGAAPRVGPDTPRVLGGFFGLLGKDAKAISHEIVAGEHDPNFAKLVPRHPVHGLGL